MIASLIIAFNESVVASKQSINSNIDKILLAVNKKRDDLLREVDDMQRKNKQVFESKLKILRQMKSICEVSKRQFESISSNQQLPMDEKRQKMQKLVSMSLANNDNDDDQKEDVSNYDHLRVIGSECTVPGVIKVQFDENAFFNTTMTSVMTVSCDNTTQQWNTKRFYGQGIQVDDGWDPNFKGNDMAINGNIVELTKTPHCQSAYLKQEVSNGVHHWIFKIVSLKHYDYYTHHIGIRGTNSTGNALQYFMRGNPAYSFCCSQGRLLGPKGQLTNANYGIKCKSGDIVEMFCDFNEMTLRYSVNGKDYGIAFENIQKCAYKAAINLRTPQEAVEFLSHTQY